MQTVVDGSYPNDGTFVPAAIVSSWRVLVGFQKSVVPDTPEYRLLCEKTESILRMIFLGVLRSSIRVLEPANTDPSDAVQQIVIGMQREVGPVRSHHHYHGSVDVFKKNLATKVQLDYKLMQDFMRDNTEKMAYMHFILDPSAKFHNYMRKDSADASVLGPGKAVPIRYITYNYSHDTTFNAPPDKFIELRARATNHPAAWAGDITEVSDHLSEDDAEDVGGFTLTAHDLEEAVSNPEAVLKRIIRPLALDFAVPETEEPPRKRKSEEDAAVAAPAISTKKPATEESLAARQMKYAVAASALAALGAAAAAIVKRDGVN